MTISTGQSEDANPEVVGWKASPGAMPPARDIDWSKEVGPWGPANPFDSVEQRHETAVERKARKLDARAARLADKARQLREHGLRFGPIHVLYAFLLVIAGNVLISGLAFAVVLGTASQGASESDIDESLTGLTSNAAFLLASLIVLWAVFGGYPLWASKARGTGSMAKDFLFKFQWKRDLLLGLGIAAGLRVAETVLVFTATSLGLDLSGSDNSSFLSDERPIIFTILLALATGLGAPFFEELFFRGFALQALQRVRFLQGKMFGRFAAPTVFAVIVSSALFGVLHVTAFNTGGAFLILLTGTLGAVFAILTLKMKRLGTAITAHAWFNSSAVVLVLFPVLQQWAFFGFAAVALLVLGAFLVEKRNKDLAARAESTSAETVEQQTVDQQAVS